VIELSKLTFGSMRMNERAVDDSAWVRLLAESMELGVTTFHASNEYASHEHFCAVFAQLERRIAKVIVKLAEPHFGDGAFDRARWRDKLDAYLRELGIERLDVVQWMWRGDLKDEPGRLAGFARDRAAILDAFAESKREGKLGAVAPFPYTAGFCDDIIAGGFDGIAVYLNPIERDLVPQIERAADAGMATIAIRPLCAGKALASTTPAECVRMVLGQRGVATAVVTYSSLEHLYGLTSSR
jgi:aryl-alcohol dehydrogenase-like predicted oxidoreductase